MTCRASVKLAGKPLGSRVVPLFPYRQHRKNHYLHLQRMAVSGTEIAPPPILCGSESGTIRALRLLPNLGTAGHLCFPCGFGQGEGSNCLRLLGSGPWR